SRARRSVYARDGVAYLRYATRQIPAGLRAVLQHRCARQGANELVCARLDATFGRLPEHPHDGHGPTVAGQYWRGRWWDECLARPFQHPRTDRYRTSVGPDARLSHTA